jgi:hypothetical protein
MNNTTTYTVRFNKVFTAGFLAGITYPEAVTFATRESAERYAAKVAGKNRDAFGTKSEFVSEDIRIEEAA